MFQTRRFLVEMFQTPQGVVSFLASYHAPSVPGAKAVEKWFARESIPSAYLALLLVYLELDRGQPVSLRSFVGG